MTNQYGNLSVVERFNQKIIKRDSGCWEWKAFLTRLGYGLFKYKGQMRAAHRVSWELNVSEIPDGLCVLHKCDNRKCVNPAHLFLGTIQDNVDDMMAKGRWRAGNQRGVNNPSSKLSEDQVLKILSLSKSGKYTHQRLADMYGVAQTTVTYILTGRRWGWLTGVAQGQTK